MTSTKTCLAEPGGESEKARRRAVIIQKEQGSLHTQVLQELAGASVSLNPTHLEAVEWENEQL